MKKKMFALILSLCLILSASAMAENITIGIAQFAEQDVTDAIAYEEKLAKLKEEMAKQPQGGPGGAPEGGDAKEGDAKEGDAEKK